MAHYKALKNFSHGVHGKPVEHVKQGHVVELDADYAEEHLEPHGLAEECDEPLTVEVKKEKVKAAKTEKKAAKEKQAKEKAEKEEKPSKKD